MQPKPHTRDVCCDESTHSTYLTYLHAFLLRFVVVGCQPFAECSLPAHFLSLSSWCADNFADPSVMTNRWSMTKLAVLLRMLSINSEAPFHTSRWLCSIQRFKWVYRRFGAVWLYGFMEPLQIRALLQGKTHQCTYGVLSSILALRN